MALLPAHWRSRISENAAGLALPFFARVWTKLCYCRLSEKRVTRGNGQNAFATSCLALFWQTRGLLPFFITWVVLALGMIFIAHLASNVFRGRDVWDSQ